MTDEAMNPLRRRMIEDMTIRKLVPRTQHGYVQRIKNFAVFLGRSPETASFEDVRRYQLHLAGSGVGVPTLNQNVATLRFFFRVTLTLFRILRHGATGDVNLRARINAIFDLLSKGQVPVAPNWYFSAAVGPTFRYIDLTITSNQVPGGAPLVSNSHSG
jgi:hypothetical protein